LLVTLDSFTQGRTFLSSIEVVWPIFFEIGRTQIFKVKVTMSLLVAFITLLFNLWDKIPLKILQIWHHYWNIHRHVLLEICHNLLKAISEGQRHQWCCRCMVTSCCRAYRLLVR
jgi:hypothetical protein